MDTIENAKHLRDNIETFENYLNGEDKGNKIKAQRYVKRGACFVVYKINEELRFIPSRFIGYIGNSFEKHENNDNRDGRVTNKAIRALLGDQITEEDIEHKNLEEQLDKYYKKIMNARTDDSNIKPDNKTHSFWVLN